MALGSGANIKMYSYLSSAILNIGIIPYTMIFMKETNKKILSKAEEMKALTYKDDLVEAGLGNETAHALVDHWATLNLGRAAMVAVSVALATWTALD